MTVRELKARLSLSDTTFTMGMSKAATATNRLQRNLQAAAVNINFFEQTLKNLDTSSFKKLLDLNEKPFVIGLTMDWKAMREDVNEFIDTHGKRGNLHAFKDLQLSLDWKYLRDQINEFVENKGAKDKRMKEFKSVEFDASMKGGSEKSLEVLIAMDGKLSALQSIFSNVSAIRDMIPPGVEKLEKAIEASSPVGAITGAFK